MGSRDVNLFCLLWVVLWHLQLGVADTRTQEPLLKDIDTETKEWIDKAQHEVLAFTEHVMKNKAVRDDKYSNSTCITCTALLAVLGRFCHIHELNTENFVKDHMCYYFPDMLQEACNWLVDEYGKDVIAGLTNNDGPDKICRKIKLCRGDGSCRLFPKDAPRLCEIEPPCPLTPLREATPNRDDGTQQKLGRPGGSVAGRSRRRYHNKIHVQSEREQVSKSASGFGAVHGSVQGILDWLLNQLSSIMSHKQPYFDEDDDRFSTEPTLRGSNWRGKDCDDQSSDVYPGRRVSDLPHDVDANCNGIYGVDPVANRSYEEVLCGQYQNGTAEWPQRGVLVIGDSASAKFRVPPSMIDASLINATSYSTLLDLIEDEFDYPQWSWGTGHGPLEPGLPIPARSFYQRLVERNRCIHRDFQNLAVNGATSVEVNDQYLAYVSRSQACFLASDHPVLATLALIGDDICTSNLSTMTTPETFRKSITSVLSRLDSTFPPDSHLLIVGVLANATHPLDPRLTYQVCFSLLLPPSPTDFDVDQDFYDYLDCMSSNPCPVFLSGNATVRKLGRDRANELNAVYADIISNKTYKNFDIAIDFIPMEQMVKDWTARGGSPVDLFEPTFGFHPSSVAYELWNEYLWKRLSDAHSEWLGPTNPHNDEIQKLFGNQGGY